MSTNKQEYLITAHQTRALAEQSGLSKECLSLSGMAILTFNKGILDRLDELCLLQTAPWISNQHHPYSPVLVFKRGAYKNIQVNVLVPPMGASPLACIIEDLVACGVKLIFLACSAWSLGPPVEFGDLLVPSFSIGNDGTSFHYGNIRANIQANPLVLDALLAACNSHKIRFHSGGNATCEAMYRITPGMLQFFRKQDCLCMENGEASTLFAVTQSLGVLGGVLFQPYIDLTQGWNPDKLNEIYQAACGKQAEIVLDAGYILSSQRTVEA